MIRQQLIFQNEKVVGNEHTAMAHRGLPDDLYSLIFSFCSIKVLGNCCQCSKHTRKLLVESQAAIHLWRHFVSLNANAKAYDLTVHKLSGFYGDGRHPAMLYRLLCKRQLRGEVEIVVMSMSGKRLRVTIKLSDDKYTMKQRVRDAQILSDGFSLEDFDLVYCRTGQKLGVYGDVKEFSPHSMSNIFHYATTFTMGVIPSLAEFSASRVAKASQWTKTLEELIDGGVFQQVLLGSYREHQIGDTNIADRYLDDLLLPHAEVNRSESLEGSHNDCKNILSGLTQQIQYMGIIVRNLRQTLNENRGSSPALKSKLASYSLIRQGIVENSIEFINSRVRSQNENIRVSKDETASMLVDFVESSNFFLENECGFTSWKFGPKMKLVTHHPFVHVFTSHCSEVTFRTRFKAMKAFCKAMFYNICRRRFIYTAILNGAVSSGAIATITRTILGISMPKLLSNALNLLLALFVPYKRPIKRVAEHVGKPGLDSFYSPSKLKFRWSPLGKTNFIHYSLRTINFKSILRYGDGAILFLLMQVMWKIFQSSLPLVLAAGFEEAIASTCRLIWYDEKAFAYRNAWYAIVFAFVTLPNNPVNALKTKSRYKSILVHYLDFLLSSMCYKILNRFIPPQVLSVAPLYIYVLPVFGLLGMANVY